MPTGSGSHRAKFCRICDKDWSALLEALSSPSRVDGESGELAFCLVAGREANAIGHLKISEQRIDLIRNFLFGYA
jgi:hypothetical protein